MTSEPAPCTQSFEGSGRISEDVGQFHKLFNLFVYLIFFFLNSLTTLSRPVTLDEKTLMQSARSLSLWVKKKVSRAGLIILKQLQWKQWNKYCKQSLVLVVPSQSS